jgi:hypothetical protein
MKPLYFVIALGLGALFWIHNQQQEETHKVKRGDIKEGEYAQESPPSMDEINYIKKFLPDYDANSPI